MAKIWTTTVILCAAVMLVWSIVFGRAFLEGMEPAQTVTALELRQNPPEIGTYVMVPDAVLRLDQLSTKNGYGSFEHTRNEEVYVVPIESPNGTPVALTRWREKPPATAQVQGTFIYTEPLPSIHTGPKSSATLMHLVVLTIGVGIPLLFGVVLTRAARSLEQAEGREASR